jgi:hypothetical protein
VRQEVDIEQGMDREEVDREEVDDRTGREVES